jgi:hypothetical protein
MPEHIIEGRVLTDEQFWDWQDAQTRSKLQAKDDCEQYRDTHGKPFHATSGGYTVIPVLQFLWGLPLTNLVLAYARGLNPTSLLISDGTITTIASPGRLAIFVDPADVVTRIQLEISVSYGSGSDLDTELRRQRQAAGLGAV